MNKVLWRVSKPCGDLEAVFLAKGTAGAKGLEAGASLPRSRAGIRNLQPESHSGPPTVFVNTFYWHTAMLMVFLVLQ